jgi:hypothetical protein
MEAKIYSGMLVPIYQMVVAVTALNRQSLAKIFPLDNSKVHSTAF